MKIIANPQVASPLIPPLFDKLGSVEDKIIFALANLGSGTVTGVIAEFERLEPGIMNAHLVAEIKRVLRGLFEHGILTGKNHHGMFTYAFPGKAE